MLTGEFHHSVDAKNRLFIPARLREELGETFIIARDIREKCLKAYSLDGWKEYIAPIKQQRRELVERVLRELHRTAMQVTPDSQGRVVMSASLLGYAQVERDVVFIGCSDYAEIWSKENYDTMIDNINDEEIRNALWEVGL